MYILKGFLGITKTKLNRNGWKPDIPDHRDHQYSAPTPVKLPNVVDLRPYCPAVYDQGQLGSCTANAIGAAIEFDQLKQNKAWDFMPSRLFIYYNERAMEGTIKTDSGAQIRDGIKSVNSMGVCKESLVPYNIKKFATKPSTTAYKEALFHKSLTYQRLDNTNIMQLKTCLNNGIPFVFGFSVYDYFESEDMATKGILNLPAKNETLQGGHAVLCVGYDDTKKMFLVRNSWGADWGIKGYFWMAYDYMTNPNLASDFWCINTINSSNK